MATAFITHADCALHDMGMHHPECPARLAAINDRLIASGIDAYLDFHDAACAGDAQILRAHDAAYLECLRSSVPERGTHHLDPDTALNPHSLDAALRAAGAGILATDLVISGQADNAFCAVRPPGHHAGRASAMGFCLLNNVAIAALHALEHHGLQRVAVVDFDVHHGNGTEDILRNDPRVMMAGIFQHPFYPYSGTEDVPAHWANVPVKAGLRGRDFREVVSARWLPALEAFAPEMIFVSAGFDAHYEDDMASCGLVEADYAWVTEQLRDFALRRCGGRIVSLLEGGYALSALGRAVVAHVRALAYL
jgi:acetoin utilization deacetylase AcuC-like enzyme